MSLPLLNEFTSWYTGEKNTPINQTVTKRTAHPPSFEISQMCSSFYRPLIFKRLKKRVHPEVNSLKWLSGVRREGERPLLLRKECRIDSQLKWGFRRGFMQPRDILRKSYKPILFNGFNRLHCTRKVGKISPRRIKAFRRYPGGAWHLLNIPIFCRRATVCCASPCFCILLIIKSL